MQHSENNSGFPNQSADVYVVSGQSKNETIATSPLVSKWETPSSCTPPTDQESAASCLNPVVSYTGCSTASSRRSETATDYWHHEKTTSGPLTVQLELDEEVIWTWDIHSDGTPYVSGYTIVKKFHL